ncbi:arogenate dehydratase/prephenate dehydratase 2 chloroplastic, partial [Phtheirospermum japonicum]
MSAASIRCRSGGDPRPDRIFSISCNRASPTMAATTSQSPITPLQSLVQNPNYNPIFTLTFLKRRRITHLHACSTGRSNNQKTQAIDLQKLIEYYPYELNPKDSLASLPRPLTSAQLSNLASEGSHLRVAYQGVRGAYSETAAEKAYPNCEVVPCEQFDTTFKRSINYVLVAWVSSTCI